MSAKHYLPPSLTLTKKEARRFLLAHQHLWPPRSLKGKSDLLKLIKHLGCIQFDTINVTARNADLVLQSRLSGYQPHILEELLYQDRALIDGWDKVASIFPASDYPYFSRHRQAMPVYHEERSPEAAQALPNILETIRQRGPLSSIDFKDKKEKVDWFWAPTTVSRAALELGFAYGKLGIHHRVGTRRVFDLIENLISADILSQPDSNTTDERYQEWHILRRIGGLGLAAPHSGEQWLGIRGVKSTQRRTIINKLAEQGNIAIVSIEGLENDIFFLRTQDLKTLKTIQTSRAPKARAAFIAPLDNLIWDRKTISKIFNFDYIWEVYKPKTQRQYGYYVLPVLYGDRFIARIEPRLDRKTNTLHIIGFWWEPDIEPTKAINNALAQCLKEFMRFVGAADLEVAPSLRRDKSLTWLPS